LPLQLHSCPGGIPGGILGCFLGCPIFFLGASTHSGSLCCLSLLCCQSRRLLRHLGLHELPQLLQALPRGGWPLLLRLLRCCWQRQAQKAQARWHWQRRRRPVSTLLRQLQLRQLLLHPLHAVILGPLPTCREQHGHQ
jgi:hypothetical protein